MNQLTRFLSSNDPFIGSVALRFLGRFLDDATWTSRGRSSLQVLLTSLASTGRSVLPIYGAYQLGNLLASFHPSPDRFFRYLHPGVSL